MYSNLNSISSNSVALCQVILTDFCIGHSFLQIEQLFLCYRPLKLRRCPNSFGQLSSQELSLFSFLRRRVKLEKQKVTKLCYELSKLRCIMSLIFVNSCYYKIICARTFHGSSLYLIVFGSTSPSYGFLLVRRSRTRLLYNQQLKSFKTVLECKLAIYSC